MKTASFVSRIRGLPSGDKSLLLVCYSVALFALGIGVLFGAGTALVRAGLIELNPLNGYRLMTQHGITTFFYWLYFVQAGLLLTLAASETASARLAWRGLAWTGLVLMIAGFALSEFGAVRGLPLLYDAPPDLAARSGEGAGALYGGYLLLGAGLFCIAAAAIATVLASRSHDIESGSSALSFAVIAWAGLIMVSAFAAIYVFLPAARWAFGLGPLPADYGVKWHVLFHNMHYLPLMATVIVWYALVKALTGVESIYGPRFSKIVFASYLVFVPPTSLYHMFLEPGLAESVRTAGSLLSLFISVPTVLVFLVIVASLETHARAHGARGLFGWVRMLPWTNPAMAAIGMAVLSLAVGGALSFVLIQEKLAPMLSDTFFVPGYFHFLTVGTVTLTALAAMCYLIPELSGRALWRPRLLARLSYVIFGGLLLFGIAGVVAGYLGVPRRTLDITYAGDAPGVWLVLMYGVSAGGTLMAAGLLVYVYGLFRTLLPGARPAAAGLPAIDWAGVTIARERAWLGPLSIAVLVAAMALFTAAAFEIMKILPLTASGGIAH